MEIECEQIRPEYYPPHGETFVMFRDHTHGRVSLYFIVRIVEDSPYYAVRVTEWVYIKSYLMHGLDRGEIEI